MTRSPFPTPVVTDRLRLERLDFDAVDIHDLYAACGTAPGVEDITAHVSWNAHSHPKETRDLIADAVEAWDAGEGAQYVVRPREGEDGAGELAGMAALSPKWDRRAATLGVWFRKRFWGRGYSGERARALAAVAFESCDLDVVEVSVLAGNERSKRAIEKYVDALGGRHDGYIRNFGSDGEEIRDADRYSITREEWLAATDGEHGVRLGED